MDRIRRITCVSLGLLGLAAIAAACGGEMPARSPTETTSASVPPAQDQSKADIARLERERDDANRQLADQLARNDEQAKRLATETDMKKERADLTRTVSATIESAQNDLVALDKKVGKAGPKVKAKLQKAIADAKEKLSTVEMNSRMIGADYGAGWGSFKTTLEGAIADLQRAIRDANEMQ